MGHLRLDGSAEVLDHFSEAAPHFAEEPFDRPFGTLLRAVTLELWVLGKDAPGFVHSSPPGLCLATRFLRVHDDSCLDAYRIRFAEASAPGSMR
jgi:hypothetical protein